MLKVRSRTNRATPHKWFAWFPVLAVQKGVNGHTYYWVWLRNVTRKFVSGANMAQWSYEIN